MAPRERLIRYVDFGLVVFVAVTALGGLFHYGLDVQMSIGYCGVVWCYPAYPTSLLIFGGFLFVLSINRPIAAPLITLFTIGLFEFLPNLGSVYTGDYALFSVWAAMMVCPVIILRVTHSGGLRPTWWFSAYIILSYVNVLPFTYSFPTGTTDATLYEGLFELMICLVVWRMTRISRFAVREPVS